MKPHKPKRTAMTELVELLKRKCPCCGNIGHRVDGSTDFNCRNAECDVRTFRVRTGTAPNPGATPV